MGKKFRVINPEGFIRSFEEMNSGKQPFATIDAKDFEIEQESTFPLDGYEAPENYPDCCSSHRSVKQSAEEYFDKFPNCCEQHKKLLTQPWFKKEHYSYLPQKLLDTTTFTWDCINRSIDHPEWYKKITDYIKYTYDSFGQFPEGFGGPVGASFYRDHLEGNLRDKVVQLPNGKHEKILSYVKELGLPPKNAERPELNLLIEKYKEWLKIFPFELPNFSHLKPMFENRMPILSGPGETNMYTGLTGFKVKTKKELIDFLVSVTEIMIENLNGLALYQNNSLPESGTYQKDVLLAHRKMELEELKNKISWKDRKGYVVLLKKWLAGEKRFIADLTKLITVGGQIFTDDFTDAIKALQQKGVNEPCIKNIRESSKQSESDFRNYFKSFFEARYKNAHVTAEEEMGRGRIDLKITEKGFTDRIIEFKGWWNNDRKHIVSQTKSYLTEFEGTGFIFMVNHLKEKSIVDDYRSIICSDETGYIDKSWKEIKANNGDYIFYESQHKVGPVQKTIKHFLFNASY